MVGFFAATRERTSPGSVCAEAASRTMACGRRRGRGTPSATPPHPAHLPAEHRLVVLHEDREKPEGGHVLAQDDETDGQGRGQEKADGTPEPGPEGDGDEKRRLRQAERLPVE